jgi:hypothetical protein
MTERIGPFALRGHVYTVMRACVDSWTDPAPTDLLVAQLVLARVKLALDEDLEQEHG